MSRHSVFTLDAATASHASVIRDTLNQANGDGIGVRISVIGRDSGATTERVGAIIGWAGIAGMSSEAITLDTDKGPRTFNVWLIRSAEIVGL